MRPFRHVAAALVVAGLPVLGLPTAAAPTPGAAAGPASVGIELAAQTPVVPPGGTFAVRLRLQGVPADGSLRVVVHQRVRSRSELAQSITGDGLRSRVLETATALATLATEADGTRRLALSLDPASGGLPLRIEGVYPVELIAQDGAGAPLATLITHLIVPPEVGDDSPPLGVAMVAELGAPPAFQPDGSTVLERNDVDALAGLVTELVATAGVPLTVAARPETLDALEQSAVPGDAAVVEALRTATADRSVLALPYADVSPDDLAAAGLLDELGVQQRRGEQVLTDVLGVSPVRSARLAPADLGVDGLAALTDAGVRRIVVSDDQVAPLDPGLISYTLAQPFLLDIPADPQPQVQALATDPTVLERLHGEGSAALVASRVLSELAFLRLEQPSVARVVVVPVDRSTPAGVTRLLLEGIGAGRPFAPLDLEAAFAHAAPVVDGGGNVVDRALLPATPRPMGATEARSFTAAREHLETFAALLGGDSPRLEPLARHLLVATATGLTARERRSHIAAVDAAVDAVAARVSTPATFTLTLTAREGTIPLTIRNDSGLPLRVTLRLRSQKLEFPEGATIERVLTEPTTRVDIAVRSRASGAFPLEVAVTSPDGERTLSTTLYTVRSTAVSGAGLLLSIGAGLFLVVWWARHWRRTRRSAKLVASGRHTRTGH